MEGGNQREKRRSAVNVMLSAVNRFFAFMAWDDIRMKRIKTQRRIFRDRDRELTKAEYLRLLDAARRRGNPRLYYLTQTLAATGVRVSDVVYNNFPWCNPTDAQQAKIEKTAQAILDARALYPDSSLADLYDETAMPPELRKAHQNNDRAVMEAYGFSVRDMDESKCVAELMKLYQRLTG